MAGGVLVAGGTGALGGAVVRELLSAGYAVTATWVLERERERVEQEFGGAGGLTLAEADLMEPDAAQGVVDGLDDPVGVVDLVGGYAGGRNVDETDIDELERMLRLNLRPLFLLARAAMPRLAAGGGGAFVGVSTRAAVRPFAGAASYIAAKAAVLAFIQALDAEYRDRGVRCNAVLPSVIDTPANREQMPNADHSKWVPPEQIARVIRFLVSEDSEPTSGAAVPVYGRA
jgi:NAD(P)-dependent dehydrogenase (short-subunit alcohol dehydrogenase family)